MVLKEYLLWRCVPRLDRSPRPRPTHSQVLGFGRSTPLPKSGSKNATADEVDSMGYARATVADRRGLAEAHMSTLLPDGESQVSKRH